MSKIDTHFQICKSLNDLYARKNADYGDSFGKSFAEYGLTMACIRLEDKLNRIKALSKQEAQVRDESITDTLMDLANYAIMTLVEMNISNTQYKPKKGNHDPHCVDVCGNCLCLTCANDNDGCCFLKSSITNVCPVTGCHDYVREDVK